MHRKIALVGVLLVLLSLVPAVTGLAQGQSGGGQATGWMSELYSRVYDEDTDTTTFTWIVYDVDGTNDMTPAEHALSHVIFGVCGADPTDSSSGLTEVSHSPTQDWDGWSYDTNNDGNPLISGYKWNYGIQPNTDKSSAPQFSITFEGNVAQAPTDIELKAGSGDETVAGQGPANSDCSQEPEPSGEISVAKSGNPSCPGGDVDWVLTLEYSTQEVPSDATVTAKIWDDQLGIDGYEITGLLPNPTGAVTITSATLGDLLEEGIDPDPEADKYYNDVTVKLYYDGTELSSYDATGEIVLYRPSLSVTVTAVDGDGNPVTSVTAGDYVSWKYEVTNTGDVDLNDVTVTDGLTNPNLGSLDAGDTTTWTSDPVQLNTPGEVTRSVTVTGEPDANISECDPSAPGSVTVTVDPPPPPDYAVTVTLDGYYDCEEGQFIWTALVTNNSSVAADIDVDFDRESFLDVTISLGPGATSDPIIRSESGSGSKTLNVTASIPETEAEDDDDATANDSACEEPPPTCEEGDAALSVAVTSSNGTARVNRGSTVDFSYTITNTGNDTLYDVEVLVNGTLFDTISVLLPGAENAVTLSDPDVVINGTTTRNVQASGATEIECGAAAQDSHTVRLRSTPPPPTYGVDVSLTGSGECDTGYTWVATVTNTSSTSATINVDFDRDGIADTSVTLGAGASTQVTRTEAGGTAGTQSLGVTASVDGRGESDAASASVTLECIIIPPPPPEQPPACVPVIKVHVVDEANAGIGGAMVQLGDFSTTTAADGWASFPGLAAGTYQISASASGYLPGSGSVTLADGACEVTTQVIVKPPTFPPPPPPPPKGHITGSICLLDSLGAVEVTLQNGQTVLVQPGGSYSFEGLSAGTYAVSANSNLGADSQTVSIGGESPLDAVVDFCFQEAPAQAPLPRTGGPLWPSYAGGMVLLALGMVLRRRIR